MDDLGSQAARIGSAARAAAGRLATVKAPARTAALVAAADALRAAAGDILAANEADVAQARAAGTAGPLVDRLVLTPAKVAGLADGVAAVAAQADPVGHRIDGHTRPDGLTVERRRVPLGVVLFLYESRPNVTADAAALCLRSGNAVVLRGGKEARRSNRAIADVMVAAFDRAGLPPDVVQLVDNPDRALVPHLLKLDRDIDLVIPRGGESLIRAVVADSTIPVLKHYAGNCHVYVDAGAVEMERQVRDVCLNAKLSYPAACNSAEKILFHRAVADRLLPVVCGDLADRGVEIRGDARTRELFPSAVPATDADWAAEYLSAVVGVAVVDSVEAAVAHINRHGSHHTDAILTADPAAIAAFVDGVDSASVMVNASTRFADGGEYGLGAEIGISTDKLHARGPMGAADLTTYKWVVTGAGHVRR